MGLCVPSQVMKGCCKLQKYCPFYFEHLLCSWYILEFLTFSWNKMNMNQIESLSHFMQRKHGELLKKNHKPQIYYGVSFIDLILINIKLRNV